jgi:hypothetical protein
MAGDIFFTNRTWSSRSSITFYVMEYLVSRLPDGPEKDAIQEYVDNNIPVLRLEERNKSHLVDLIADGLPNHVAAVEDPRRRESLEVLLADLFRYAKEQQAYNAERRDGERGQ